MTSVQAGRNGAAGGIDGLIHIRSAARTTERAIGGVKGGGTVGVPLVQGLTGVLDREAAPIGLFPTLAAPTQRMRKEAAAARPGTPGGRQHPRIQLTTTTQALNSMHPAIPWVDKGAAFKRAHRERGVGRSNLPQREQRGLTRDAGRHGLGG